MDGFNHRAAIRRANCRRADRSSGAPHRGRAWILVAALLTLAPQAAAAELDLGVDLPPVAIHGFVSPGFVVSIGNEYLAKSSEGTFEFVEVGINFTSQLTEQLRIGVQIFARDLGRRGDYTPKADWFYLDYRIADWIGLRAGRTKLPFGLLNEVNDIDQARVPILLPQSIYPITNRDFLLAQTGVELYGYVVMGDAGALDYRIYGGTIFFDVDSSAGGQFDVDELSVPYLVGGRLMWETPAPGLRVGGSVQALRLDTTLSVTQPQPLTLTADIEALLWVVSLELTVDDAMVAMEYSRWHVQTHSSQPTLIPEAEVISERAYALFSYRVDWFTPGVYYSVLFPDVDDRTGREQRQHDVALTLRFDINEFWLVKVEGHYMNGTAATEPILNGGRPRSELDEDWAVFLLKTTAWF